MNQVNIFNPLQVPLQGINLIEASAGTGKTYNLEVLFIRLILEKKLHVNQILVVTFMQAASEELRHRIRQRLRQALAAFARGDSEDLLLAELIKRPGDTDEAIRRLSNALRGFDEAAISTIHSFCRRALQESSTWFDTEVIGDQTPLLQEIVEDFWRQHFYEASPLFIAYATGEGYQNPADLLKILGPHLGQPFLQIIPRPALPETDSQERAFEEIFGQVQEQWSFQRTPIEELLLKHRGLNRNKYRETSIPKWCQQLTALLETHSLDLLKTDFFKKLTASHLATSVNKNASPPQHEFFDLCEKLYVSYQSLAASFKQRLLALKIKLLEVACDELVKRKQQRRIQSYDDLLINLYAALMKKESVEQLRRKYHAALVDEFQDTDPIQYEIFRTIFGTQPHILFLIGDPKQAIYSFRGADIFTYLAASRQADSHYTLSTNWRSEAKLITAVNTLFRQVEQPFIFTGIPFYPVQVPVNRSTTPLSAPLQIWFIARNHAGKGGASEHLLLAIGNEITRLLTQVEKPLIPGDLAILVRTNQQARMMQAVLTRLRIPSVLYSRESLFSSHEVLEIERVLLAIANPHEEGFVKAALTTDLLGWSGNQLYLLMNQRELWQQRLDRFQKYHSDWSTLGFIRMFRRFLLEEHVLPRLLSYPDGERRLTNVLHATECLHQAFIHQKLGRRGLCRWLSQQREANKEVAEEQQLRLESDEKLVKIVTIHKSKGLEYPIVFCPFVWDGKLRTRQAEQFIFHDEDGQLILDLGSEQQDYYRQLALEEERAEILRLFYVAVTRAKQRCYLVWGAFKDAHTSAPAHLWHPHTQVTSVNDEVLLAELANLTKTGEIQVTPLQLPVAPLVYQRALEHPPSFTVRPFLGKIDKSWQVASFTSLRSANHSLEAVEHPDYYDEMMRGTEELRQPSIFSFPRGARAGSFIHSLFENLDFTRPVEVELVNQQLQTFGYEVEKWQEVMVTMLGDVLATPLATQRPEFTLAAIPNEKRLNELEFYYSLPSLVTAAGLQAIFADEGIPIGHFSSVQGLMKGFIDLVFEYEGRYYLVDYKSNFLGYQMQAYHSSKLASVMARQAYFLQYHLYVVALHRYLAIQLPNYCYKRHFGGVYYLFVRGLRPYWGTHFGIYRDLPKLELIDRLSAYLSF